MPWALDVAATCLDGDGRWVRPMFGGAYFAGTDFQDDLEAAVSLAARVVRVYLKSQDTRTPDEHRLMQWVTSLSR